MGAAAAAALSSTKAFGQKTSNSTEARNDYARIYQTPDVGPLLVQAQADRLRAPLDPKLFSDFVKGSSIVSAFNLVLLNAGNVVGQPLKPTISMAPAVRESINITAYTLWHTAALQLTANDHSTDGRTPTPKSYGEQFGPARTSWCLAIFHLALFEAVNTITKARKSHRNLQESIVAAVGGATPISPDTASIAQALTSASVKILNALYPEKKTDVDPYLREAVGHNGDSASAKSLGAKIGEAAADAVLALRSYDIDQGRFVDGSQNSDPPISIFDQSSPNWWRQDPITLGKNALGANWEAVRPFVLKNGQVFMPDPPPGFRTDDFRMSYKEVKTLGGDDRDTTEPRRFKTQTTRTGSLIDKADLLDRNNQTFVGVYWGYDGTALLCAPMRLYNMIAFSVAMQEQKAKISTVTDLAHYMALVNLALGDAGIAAWTAKYHYLYPRPVTYIRAVDADTTTEGRSDPHWTPLGAPVSNGTAEGRNLTPPFPSYPSGHATFGGALFGTMSRYFGLDKADAATQFAFTSDEFNGKNRGPGELAPRASKEVKFPSFAAAEMDNALSRLYIGVHWRFDATAGIQQGDRVADYVFNNAFV